MDIFKSIFGSLSKKQAVEFVDEFNSRQKEIEESGSFDGAHYTDYVEIVKALKREGKNEEAIRLLINCVEATENESKNAGERWGVAPWYYEQLAILYRKEKNYSKEVEILERYEKQAKAPGDGPSKLATRLLKARELSKKNNS